MIQMRWAKPAPAESNRMKGYFCSPDEDTPKGVVKGCPENGDGYYVLQYRQIIGIDRDGFPIATEWETVRTEE